MKQLKIFKSQVILKTLIILNNNKFLLLPTRDLKSWLTINSLDKDEFLKMKESWFEEIMKIKSKRTKPRIDDKSIVSWNALAIVGLIDAYDAFKDDLFLSKAKNMFSTILKRGYKDNMLVHTFTFVLNVQF